jgi:ATP-binding cassette subfamily F protein 3
MITLEGIELRRGPNALLQDASIQVFPGDRLGLVGANGCGKSSLFALLRGEITQDAGELAIPADWTVAHIAQEISDTSVSARNHVLAGDAQWWQLNAAIAEAEQQERGQAMVELHSQFDAIDGYAAPARAARLLAGLGFSESQLAQPLSAFSGGWRMRLSLARALMCRSDLLLLDEPTNHLDMDAIVWLEDWLLRYEGTLILISHDRAFLNRVVTRVAHIEQCHLFDYRGDYDQFERQRAERLAQQQAQFEREQATRAHLQSFVDRFRAKASKAKQAQSRLKALERLNTSAPMLAQQNFALDFPSGQRFPEPLLSLDQAELGYPQASILHQVRWQLRAGDRIGVLGRNGAGKSTLVRSIAGELEVLAGERVAGRGLRIGYFAQHQLEQLNPSMTPLETLRDWTDDEAFAERDRSEQALRDFLGRYGFGGEFADQPIGPRSGGEKARLVLGLLAWQRPHLLLLDEPTNHLDLPMREAVAAALQSFEGALLLVAHDRHLLELCCDDFWLVANGRLERFDDDMDAYVRWLRSRDSALDGEKADSTTTTSNNRRAQRQQRAQQMAQLKPQRARVKQLEQALDKAQQAEQKLAEALANPSLYEDDSHSQEVAKLSKDHGQALQEKSTLEEQWLEAVEALELAEAELSEGVA